jgi:hypothetical protein
MSNQDKMREPSFLMVLTGGQYAFKRKDGVLVVTVGSKYLGGLFPLEELP